VPKLRRAPSACQHSTTDVVEMLAKTIADRDSRLIAEARRLANPELTAWIDHWETLSRYTKLTGREYVTEIARLPPPPRLREALLPSDKRSREALYNAVETIRLSDPDWDNALTRVAWLEAIFTDGRVPLRAIRRELRDISERDWRWTPQPRPHDDREWPQWPTSLLHCAPDKLRVQHHFMLHAHIEELEAKIPGLDSGPMDVQAALARELERLDALKDPLPTDAQISRDEVISALRIGFVESFFPQSHDGNGQLDWTVLAPALEALGPTERNRLFKAVRRGIKLGERSAKLRHRHDMVDEFFRTAGVVSRAELAEKYLVWRAIANDLAANSDVRVFDPKNWRVADLRVEDPENWRVISGLSDERRLMTIANSEQEPITIIPAREPIKIKVPKEVRKKIRDAINKTRPKFHRGRKVSFDRTAAGAYVVRDDDGTPARPIHVVRDAHGTLKLATEKKFRTVRFYEKEKIPEYGTPLPCSRQLKQDAPERGGSAVRKLKKLLKGTSAIIIDTKTGRRVACDGRLILVRPSPAPSWGTGLFEPRYKTYKTVSPIAVDPWGPPPRDPWFR